jgi:hypothetical protein
MCYIKCANLEVYQPEDLRCDSLLFLFKKRERKRERKGSGGKKTYHRFQSSEDKR